MSDSDFNFDEFPETKAVPPLTSGDLGDGGEEVENARIPVSPMPPPPKMPPPSPEMAKRIKDAKAGVKLADVPVDQRLSQQHSDFNFEEYPASSPPADPQRDAAEAMLRETPNPAAVSYAAHNSGLAPAAGTDAANLADQTNLGPSFVAQNLPEVQQRVDQDKTTDDLARAPGVASYMSQSPAHASAAKDDTSILSDIENIVTGRFEMPDIQALAFSGGKQGQGSYSSPLWFRKLRDSLTEQRATALEGYHLALKAGLASGIIAPRGSESGKAAALAESLADVNAEAAKAGPGDTQPVDDTLVGKAVGGAVGTAPYMAGAIVSSAVGRSAGGKAGEAVALAGFNLWETYGPAAKSLRQVKNPDGSPAYSDEQVIMLAGMSAAAQTTAMTAVQEATGSVFGAPMIRGEVNAAATEWLRTGGANLVKGALARYGFHGVMGAFVMATQHAIHTTVEEFGADQNGRPHDYSRPLREFPNAFKEGLESMILPAALGPGMEIYGREKVALPSPETLATVGRRAAMDQEQAKLNALIENAENSRLVRRSPEQAQAAMAPGTEQPGASDTAYIDKEAFDRVHGPLAQAVAESQGGNYAEAHLLGAAVAIPLEAHLANARDGSARALLSATKLSPDGTTPFEQMKGEQPEIHELLASDMIHEVTGEARGVETELNSHTTLTAEQREKLGLPPDAPVASIVPPEPAEPQNITDERESLRSQVAEEIGADPAGKALSTMQKNGGVDFDRSYVRKTMGRELFDRLDSQGKVGMKLDSKFVREQMGSAIYDRLNKMGVLGDNQMHPNDLSSLLGFSNAHEMVSAILSLPDEKEQERMVQKRLEENHPEMKNVGETQEAAIEAAHSPQEMERVLREINELKEQLGGASKYSPKSALVEAGKRLARPDLFPPEHYALLENEAEERARDASMRGDAPAERAARDAKDVATASRLEAEKYQEEQKAAEEKAASDDAKAHKRLMSGAVERPGELEMSDVQHSAEAEVNKKAIGDIDPRYYLAAERSAADRAAQAASKGDIQGTIDAKREQLASMFAWREARKLKAEMGQIRRVLKNSYDQDARGKLGLAGQAYLNGVDISMEAIAEAHESQNPKVPLAAENWWQQGRDAERKAALEGTFNQMWLDGYPSADVPPALRDLVNPDNGKFRDWSGLTPQEARDVASSIGEIQRMGKMVRDLDIQNEKDTKYEIIQKTTEETNALPSAEPVKYTSGNPRPWYASPRGWLNKVLASLAEHKTNTLRLGPTAHRVLFESMVDHMNNRDALETKILPALNSLVNELPDNIVERAYEKTDLSQYFPLPANKAALDGVPRLWLYMLHLHRMSAGNMDRVLSGPTSLDDPIATQEARAKDPSAPTVKFATPWTQENVDFVLDKNPATRLTRAEADMLQKVSDLQTHGVPSKGVPALWELIRQTQQDRYGIPPPKVAGVPRILTFADGTSKFYEGGYHHLAEDRSNLPAATGAPKTVDDLLGGEKYQPAVTPSGFAKERAATASYMTDMTWTSIPAHINQAIHDVAMGDWVRGAGQLVLNSEFKGVMDRVLGPARADAVVNQVRTTAQQRVHTVAGGADAIWDAFNVLKRSTVASISGFSIPFAMMQFAHFSGLVTGGKVSAKNGALALIHTMLPDKPISFSDDSEVRFPGVEAAHEESKALQHRDLANANLLGEARTVFGRSDRQGIAKTVLAPFDAYATHQGVFLHWVDRFIGAWARNAAYADAKDAGVSDDEASARAEGLVQDVMPDHSVETRAPILSDKNLAASTLIMHGFGSKLFNIAHRDVFQPLSDAVHNRDLAAVGRAGMKAVQMQAMLTTLSVVGKLLSGGGPEKDESKSAWLTRTSLASPGMLLPYMGAPAEAAAAAATRHLPDWWVRDDQGRGAAKTFHYSLFQAPGARILEKFASVAAEMGSDKKATSQKTLDAIGAIMQLGGLGPAPLKQIGYATDVASGRTHPRGPGDVAAGALGWSTRKGANRNLGTMEQDQFSPPGTSQ